MGSSPFSDSLRKRIHLIIFGHDTVSGKAFDVVLLIAIALSILTVMLESVSSLQPQYGHALHVTEWILTILFSVEYVVRIYVAPRRLGYVFSFLGIIDFVSIAPTYASLFIPGTQALLTIRALRLLRVFRILKLVDFLREVEELTSAIRDSARKIIVFLGGVMIVITIMGSLMYLIEGAEHGFTSIPRSVYWAVVTMTTVGYGDIAPQTVLGQVVAAFVMLIGYGIIAVPTGIVSADLVLGRKHRAQLCNGCGASSHDVDATFCNHCGEKLSKRTAR